MAWRLINLSKSCNAHGLFGVNQYPVSAQVKASARFQLRLSSWLNTVFALYSADGLHAVQGGFT